LKKTEKTKYTDITQMKFTDLSSVQLPTMPVEH